MTQSSAGPFCGVLDVRFTQPALDPPGRRTPPRLRRGGALDDQTGEAHDFALVKRLLHEELESILSIRGAEAGDDPGPALAAQEERYRKSYKIAMRWIKNYTDFDFRSLGSYTRADLDAIAAADDAF